MRRTSKPITIVILSIMIMLLFTGCDEIKKDEIEILEDAENITQTVVFRGYGEYTSDAIYRAKYKGKEQMFFSDWLDDEKLWSKARILDEDASSIVLLNKKIKDDIFIEKYFIGSNYENLLCFSKKGFYYGFNVNFSGWVPQFVGEFEIEEEDLMDLYIDKEENLAIVNPEYEVLNYGTFKLDWYSSVNYDYFYFVSSREVYIYDGETAELYKKIEVDADIYGASYGGRPEKFLVAVKDGEQFKVMEYDI